MTDYDLGGFHVNLRSKKYQSIRTIDLISIMPDGKILR